jgi:hypothetical protein
MNDGVEILVAPGGQIYQRDTAIGGFGMPFPAVNRDAMPALDQPDGKLLGEGLKPAIPGGNPTRAENRDVRRGPPPRLDPA